MNKIYLFTILNLIGYFSIAQPSFTSNNCFQLNDSSRLGYAIVTKSFDSYISQTGNNYTWDFSSTGFPGRWGTWTSPTIPYKFQPSGQSTHVVFQSTQINEYSNVAFARDHFYSYSPANDTLYFYGYYASADYKYYNPIPYLTFPLSYKDSVYSYIPQKVGSTLVGSVSRYWIYDGFGDVKFSYGSAKNVYRIRTKQIDSSYINGTFISAFVNEEMIWFRQSDGIPVLRFEKQGASNIGAYYASVSASSGIYQSQSSKILYTYPNPTENLISIKSDISLIGLHYTIRDQVGKQVLSGDFNDDSASINLRELSNGLYILQIEDETTHTLKIVKR